MFVYIYRDDDQEEEKSKLTSIKYKSIDWVCLHVYYY